MSEIDTEQIHIGLFRLEREKMAFLRAERELERASNECGEGGRDIDGETCGWMELDILALCFSALFRIRGTEIIYNLDQANFSPLWFAAHFVVF